MSTETYTKEVIIGKDGKHSEKKVIKTYVRADREQRTKYERFMKSQGLKKVYVDLPFGKRGFTWER